MGDVIRPEDCRPVQKHGLSGLGWASDIIRYYTLDSAARLHEYRVFLVARVIGFSAKLVGSFVFTNSVDIRFVIAPYI